MGPFGWFLTGFCVHRWALPDLCGDRVGRRVSFSLSIFWSPPFSCSLFLVLSEACSLLAGTLPLKVRWGWAGLGHCPGSPFRGFFLLVLFHLISRAAVSCTPNQSRVYVRLIFN